MKKIILGQFVILLLGVLFAWGNFSIELINWLNVSSCASGCPTLATNPFLSSCFYGAIFFTVAFILNCFLVKKS